MKGEWGAVFRLSQPAKGEDQAEKWGEMSTSLVAKYPTDAS